MVKSIIFAGVGGQGTLLASRIIGDVLLKQGFDAKVSEVHGMSQRGGSVVTYVKYDADGGEVYSPTVELGEADFIAAFELMEAARWLPYLKKGGKMLINSQKIPPMPVITGQAGYNLEIAGKIRALGIDVIEIDALALAEKAGAVKAVNVVMMGALSKELGFDKRLWEEAVRECVPEKALAANERAFEAGAGK